MTVNVREALLNDPENGGFQILRETPQILWQIEINCDLAAFGKPIQVRTKTRGEPNFIQQWWMKQMGDGAQFSRQFLYQTDTFPDCLGSAGSDVAVFRLHQRQVHAESSE